MTTSSRQTRLWIEIDSKFYCTADRRPNVNAKHLFRTTTVNTEPFLQRPGHAGPPHPGRPINCKVHDPPDPVARRRRCAGELCAGEAAPLHPECTLAHHDSRSRRYHTATTPPPRRRPAATPRQPTLVTGHPRSPVERPRETPPHRAHGRTAAPRLPLPARRPRGARPRAARGARRLRAEQSELLIRARLRAQSSSAAGQVGQPSASPFWSQWTKKPMLTMQ